MKPERLTLIASSLVAALSAIGAEEAISFNEDIRPILSDRCFKCHGPDSENQKSDLRLDTREHATADLGDGFFGIVPGNLEESDVHWRIWDDVEEDRMPPADSNLSLSDEEKKLLDRWMEEGAEYDTHWSFKPLPGRIDVPDSNTGWTRNEIDRFVEAKFVENELEPAPESPKEKWLRRVSFDLTGLPPSIEEIEDFLSDGSSDAYKRVVDRLLNSSAYAERMTSEWLDVARYSDSFGYQRDDARFVWPWRDWVIGAFEQNMPYDAFVSLQLAGDLLPNATQEEILPTAFNRLHAHKKEGGIVLEEYRVEYVADRTQTFSSAFLGLTMDCARCHDHKYDPLPTKDYYELSSFFANIDESGLISFFTDAVPTPAMPYSNPETDAILASAEEKIEEIGSRLRSLEAGLADSEAFHNWLSDRPDMLWSDLVADVSFDELVDGTFENAALKDTPAKMLEANKVVPGVSGNGVQLTGDDHMYVPEVGHFAREDPFSFAIWIRPDAIIERENILSRSGGADDSASMGYELLLLDGKVTFSLTHFWPGNSMRVQTMDPVKAREWTHIVVTYDGSSDANGAQIFLDGVKQDLEIVRNGLTREIDNYRSGKKDIWRKHIVIGQRYRDRGFKNGQVDEFRMFSREISDAEAIQLFDGRYLADLLRKDKIELSAVERSQLLEYYLSKVNPEANVLRTDLRAARGKWNDTMDALPEITVMRELPEPRPAYVLQRGVYDSHGEEVFADTPGVLPPFPDALPRNRLGLAKWLTDPDHPLTARVAVNRYWQLVFGEGLVRTPEDFGSQGSPPTHPQLLDWLARDFVDSGWDLHCLLKRMVLSATYRQSTQTDPSKRQRDPENRWLARSAPDRLAAEMIRDNALAVSGLLVDKVGGEPVKPYDLADSFKPMEPDEGDGLYRRSLYTFWKRNAPAPAMVAFDASTRDVCSLKRETTASPLQPLVTLNGPQFVEASRVLSGKLLDKHEGEIEAVIEEAFLLLTSRHPDSRETQILKNLYGDQLDEFSSKPDDAEKYLATGNAPLVVSRSLGEHAAATVVVNAVMNLNESLIQR